MHEIQLRDAKATLSAVIDSARRGEPSIITRHGRREAVVVSFEEWERLSHVPSFGRLLMTAPIEPDDLSERDGGRLRELSGLRGVYLVDTNVISAAAPTKSQAVPDLIGWMEENAPRLYLSVITIAEVEDAIAKARRQGATRKADRLVELRLETLLHLYAAPRSASGRRGGSAPRCAVRSGESSGSRAWTGRPCDRRDSREPGLHGSDAQRAALPGFVGAVPRSCPKCLPISGFVGRFCTTPSLVGISMAQYFSLPDAYPVPRRFVLPQPASGSRRCDGVTWFWMKAASKHRDVDVTVTISQDGSITGALKAYEVQHEREPLDVVDVEQLCLKLLEMPTVTHRSIVSASGFTASARSKACCHGITLYELRPWTDHSRATSSCTYNARDGRGMFSYESDAALLDRRTMFASRTRSEDAVLGSTSRQLI